MKLFSRPNRLRLPGVADPDKGLSGKAGLRRGNHHFLGDRPGSLLPVGVIGVPEFHVQSLGHSRQILSRFQRHFHLRRLAGSQPPHNVGIGILGQIEGRRRIKYHREIFHICIPAGVGHLQRIGLGFSRFQRRPGSRPLDLYRRLAPGSPSAPALSAAPCRCLLRLIQFYRQNSSAGGTLFPHLEVKNRIPSRVGDFRKRNLELQGFSPVGHYFYRRLPVGLIAVPPSADHKISLFDIFQRRISRHRDRQAGGSPFFQGVHPFFGLVRTAQTVIGD